MISIQLAFGVVLVALAWGLAVVAILRAAHNAQGIR